MYSRLHLAFDGMGEWTRLIDTFTAHERARGIAERTIRNRRTLLWTLARAIEKPPADVGYDDLIRHLGRGIASSSKVRERSDMRVFFRWAKKHRMVARNPAKDLPKVHATRGTPRPLTLEQINAMLACGSYRRTRMMILLGYTAGMRAHEIAKIRGEDVDLISGTIYVLGKGGRERWVPLNVLVLAEMLAHPELYPREGYWFPGRKARAGSHIAAGSVSDLMRRARLRAGITNARLTGHSLRHSFATELVDADVPIEVVQELMGHASLATTQIYTRVSERRRREGAARLPEVVVPVKAGRAHQHAGEERATLAA